MQLLLRWMKVVRIAGDDPSVDEPGNDFLPANVWRSCRPRNMNFATHCAARRGSAARRRNQDRAFGSEQFHDDVCVGRGRGALGNSALAISTSADVTATRTPASKGADRVLPALELQG
jgi:hypothetical protein